MHCTTSLSIIHSSDVETQQQTVRCFDFPKCLLHPPPLVDLARSRKASGLFFICFCRVGSFVGSGLFIWPVSGCTGGCGLQYRRFGDATGAPSVHLARHGCRCLCSCRLPLTPHPSPLTPEPLPLNSSYQVGATAQGFGTQRTNP